MSRGRHKQGRRDRAFEAFRLKVEAAGPDSDRVGRGSIWSAPSAATCSCGAATVKPII